MTAVSARWDQTKPPTVGDTVWIAIQVKLPARMILRPQTWDLGEEGQVLGPPEVVYAADSATVRYPIALWAAGEHALTVPGPIVVSPEGKSDTLAATHYRLEVASVLPTNAPKTSLVPKDAAPRLEQAATSWLPLTIGLVLAAVVLGGLAAALWRRRTQRRVERPAPRAPTRDLVAEIEAWAALGEIRSALDGWAHLIERELERRNDPELTRAAEPLLEALALGGFQPGLSTAESDRLLRAARDWWTRRAA